MRRTMVILLTASLIAGAIVLGIGRSLEQRAKDAAFFDAVDKGDFTAAHRLLRAGASPNADGCKWQDIEPMWLDRVTQRVFGRSPARCSEKNCVAVLALPALYRPGTDTTLLTDLLKRGANPNPAAQVTDQSPLCTAIELGNLEAATVLLASGANPNSVFEDGKTAMTEVFRHSGMLEYLAPKSTDKLLRLLLLRGASLTLPHARNPLCESVALEDSHTSMDMLIRKGARVNGAFYRGETPIIAAASHADEDMVKYLIARRAEVNAVDVEGRSALHHAARWGNLPMVKFLLAHGADPTKRDKWGRTPSEEARSALPYSPDTVRVLETAVKRR